MPVKLYLKKFAADWIWPVDCSELTPDLGPFNTIHFMGKLYTKAFKGIVLRIFLHSAYLGSEVF